MIVSSKSWGRIRSRRNSSSCTYTPLLSRPCSPEIVCLQSKVSYQATRSSWSPCRVEPGGSSRRALEVRTRRQHRFGYPARGVSCFLGSGGSSHRGGIWVLIRGHSRIGRSGGEPVEQRRQISNLERVPRGVSMICPASHGDGWVLQRLRAVAMVGLRLRGGRGRCEKGEQQRSGRAVCRRVSGGRTGEGGEGWHEA